MSINFYVKSKDKTFLTNASQELVNDLSQQNVTLYRINKDAVTYDPLYGEASNVETNYYKWSDVYCFIRYVPPELAREKYGVDHAHVINCYFDYDYVSVLDADVPGPSECLVREGDYLIHEGKTFVVHRSVKVERVFGLENTPRTLLAECHSTRDQVFTV